MIEGFIILVIILVIWLFVQPTERPDGCTCQTWNTFQAGPVDECPVHKVWLDDLDRSDEEEM